MWYSLLTCQCTSNTTMVSTPSARQRRSISLWPWMAASRQPKFGPGNSDRYIDGTCVILAASASVPTVRLLSLSLRARPAIQRRGSSKRRGWIPGRARHGTGSCSRRSPVRDVVRPHRHRDVLGLQEHLVAPGAALAAGARGLGAAERLAQVAHVLAVDEAHAGLDRRGDAVRAADVLGPDVAGEPVLRVVGDADRVGLVLERDQAGHRAED